MEDFTGEGKCKSRRSWSKFVPLVFFVLVTLGGSIFVYRDWNRSYGGNIRIVFVVLLW